jgi:hypothetical protein
MLKNCTCQDGTAAGLFYQSCGTWCKIPARLTFQSLVSIMIHDRLPSKIPRRADKHGCLTRGFMFLFRNRLALRTS